MQWFLGDPASGMLNLEAHRLTLAIAKKTLEENCFKTAQKTMDRTPSSFKIGDQVYFKNKQPGKWDFKWRPGYKIVWIECDGHFLHIENQATGKIQSCYVKDIVLEPPVEVWSIDTQFGRVGKFINHPTNHKSSWLTDIITHTFSTVNNWHPSSLQHDMHDHPHHHLNYKGNGRISSFSICFESISDMPFMDNHCTCITRTLGTSL